MSKDYLEMMWGRMEEQLEQREIPKDQWHTSLTYASLAEMEVRNPEDYGKVVRTIHNRLEAPLQLLRLLNQLTKSTGCRVLLNLLVPDLGMKLREPLG